MFCMWSQLVAQREPPSPHLRHAHNSPDAQFLTNPQAAFSRFVGAIFTAARRVICPRHTAKPLKLPWKSSRTQQNVLPAALSLVPSPDLFQALALLNQ